MLAQTYSQLFSVQSFVTALAVVLPIDADKARLSRVCSWLQLRSVSLLGTKADLLAEMTFSLVLSVPRGFSDFVESPLCEIGFPKALFGVVSPFSGALAVPSGFID
ncbi:hypothetical protein AAFX21_15180 [Vibrio campbellii]